MNHPSDITEFLSALKASGKYASQVVCHRTLQKQDARYGPLPDSLRPEPRAAAAASGIESLYAHQTAALEQLQRGGDVMVATPTASGKSLIYTLAVFDRLCRSPQSRALYLFPLKALAQDQRQATEHFFSRMPPSFRESVPRISGIYDGDTSGYMRKKMRDQPPPILITNPDMLHLSILPYHASWSAYFRDLTHVVIDEVHTYRGVFGSHMAWVVRRLQRVARFYGADPRFILLSATVGNPAALGRDLVGRPVSVVTETSAPRAEKDVVFVNPWDSPAVTTSQFIEAAIKRGLRTIVYTQSRKMAELIAMWTRPRLGSLSDKLSAYRAGFLPEERREIERQLSDGRLLGVISTSALELGIDIGDLDLCILVGYPGSLMASWQRSGRVGRGGQRSAVVLIAGEDALDQFYVQHPEAFFSGRIESAVLNPANPAIMKAHLHCAAAEIHLSAKEPLLADDTVRKRVHSLAKEATLLETAAGGRWLPTRKRPQRQVSLRGTGSQLVIVDGSDNRPIGEIDALRAVKACHPGAVYLHRGRRWLIETLDLERKTAVAVRATPPYYTRAMGEKQTEILTVLDQKAVCCYRVSLGRLRVTEKTTAYERRCMSTHRHMETIPLDLPDQIFETVGLWLDVPDEVRHEIIGRQRHFMGALHALEHAIIAMFPLVVLCDRNDIGGISCPIHAQTQLASIFVYDGHSGGVGLAEAAYARIDELMAQTAKTVAACPCADGCPACVHSPKCGSGNRPIDKRGCIDLLAAMARPGGPHPLPATQQTAPVPAGRPGDAPHPDHWRELLPERFGVFDLETIRSAAEVGGWHRADRMGISLGVVYDAKLDGYVTYMEDEVPRLVDHLMELDLVVGFNNKRFDNRVLSAYTDVPLEALPTVDMMEEVTRHLGYRLSLNRIAAATLGTEKAGDGRLALQWYAEGNLAKLRQYCKKDVAITKDIFLFALEKGFVLFRDKSGARVRLHLSVDRTLRRIFGP